MTLHLDFLPRVDTWDEVGDALARRTCAYDEPRRVLLMRVDASLALYEQPSTWRARHRRGVHRLGFRPRKRPGGVMWEWTVSEDDVHKELESRELDDPVALRIYTRLAQDLLIADRSVVVLRDVFGLAPNDVHLTALVDDEDGLWNEAL